MRLALLVPFPSLHFSSPDYVDLVHVHVNVYLENRHTCSTHVHVVEPMCRRKPFYLVSAACFETGKILTKKEDFQKLCAAPRSEFWLERLGPDMCMCSNFAAEEEDEEEEKKTEEREWSTCTCTPSPCSLLAHASTRTSRSTCKEATALNACILIGPFLKKSEMLLRSSGVAGTAVQSSRVCGPVLCAPVPMLDISGCLVGSASQHKPCKIRRPTDHIKKKQAATTAADRRRYRY